ncbi:MAG: DUF4390 domain-containing protein [Gammaproteobacteria bacterium]|nr:DUF4390 domain-containing protein [Gammaproteobacteria bacterium]
MRLKGTMRILLLCWISITVITPVLGEDTPVFQIGQAEFQLIDSLLILESRIDIELPEYIEIAVDQGFAVPVSFEVEILEDRKYWLDKKIVSLKQQYLLHYLPMLNSYVVSDINRGTRAYFDSRQDAVNSLQQISQYPMFDIGNISADLKVYARMRFGLDSDELPLPLKSSSLWANDWDLQSEWFSWEIDRINP